MASLNLDTGTISEVTSSPLTMFPEIQEEGNELQEVLRLLKQTTSKPLSGAVLPTPANKKAHKINKTNKKMQKLRESPRLKAKLNKGKSVTLMAQEIIAKKCGILDEAHQLDTMTLQQYINMYKQPMTEDRMKAIEKPTEITVKKKTEAAKTKKSKKMKKMAAEPTVPFGNKAKKSKVQG